MARKKKQKPGDEQLLYDESADSVERASALSRLAADGRTDLVPVAKAWLTHDDVMLRSEAVSMLLSFWRLEEALPATIEMLHQDPDPTVRAMAAGCLSAFAKDTQSHQDLIVGELVRQLEHDTDPVAQRTIYEELLDHVASGVKHPRLPYLFDRDRDVNWELLAPWRRH